MAGSHRVSGLGRLRRRLGDFTDYAPFLTTAINDAASVARVAVAPTPTTQIAYPSGLVATASGGALMPSLSPALTGIGGNTLGGSLAGFLNSPVFLLGLGLVAVTIVSRR
jgi:hypothetical protein